MNILYSRLLRSYVVIKAEYTIKLNSLVKFDNGLYKMTSKSYNKMTDSNYNYSICLNNTEYNDINYFLRKRLVGC